MLKEGGYRYMNPNHNDTMLILMSYLKDSLALTYGVDHESLEMSCHRHNRLEIRPLKFDNKGPLR